MIGMSAACDELRMQFEALVADPWDSWLGCVMPFRIIGPASNVKSMIGSISLHQGRGSVGNGGGSFAHMKTFACKLYLPLGGHRFRSRHAYRLAYASRSMDRIDRAHHGQARINLRLCRKGGFDPNEWSFPPKPKRMRWHTYNRAEEKFDHYESVLDEGTFALVGLVFRYLRPRALAAAFK